MLPKTLARIAAALAAVTAVAGLSCAPRDCQDRSTVPEPERSVAAVPEKTPPDIVTVRDGRLWLDGRRYRFVGVNVYSLASVPHGTDGFHCGAGFSDDEVKQVLREIADMGANAVRVQAYQSHTSGGSDFRRTDLITETARELGIKVIFTLENQWDDCTQGGYKYASWYHKRFRKPYGSYKRSYKEYVRDFVTHYRDEPAVLMYQLMNESESVAPDEFPDPEALLGFTREMAAVVKEHDPDHLLSLGTSGIHKAGSGGPFFALLHLVEGVDVVEAHDYGSDRTSLPDPIRAAQLTARQINKPFFVGEIGISSPPFTKKDRAHFLKRKLEAAWEADIDGALIWSYRSGDGGGNDFGPRDPLVGRIKRFTDVNGIKPKP